LLLEARPIVVPWREALAGCCALLAAVFFLLGTFLPETVFFLFEILFRLFFDWVLFLLPAVFVAVFLDDFLAAVLAAFFAAFLRLTVDLAVFFATGFFRMAFFTVFLAPLAFLFLAAALSLGIVPASKYASENRRLYRRRAPAEASMARMAISQGFVIAVPCQPGCPCSATTVVWSPPRTLNLAVSRMCRGLSKPHRSSRMRFVTSS